MSDTIAEVKPTGQRARKAQMRSFIRSIGMLPVLIILGILVQVAGVYFTGEGRFLTWQNLSIVAQQASINAVLGAGMTFVILTGGIDLSVGSILAAAAVVALLASQDCWLSRHSSPELLTGLIIGLGNGVLIAFLRLPPFIVTLGSLTAVRGLARLLGNDTTVFNADLPFAFIGNSSIAHRRLFSIPWLVVIAFLVIVGSWLVLRRTVLGVHIYAVGGNDNGGAAVGHQGLGGAAVRLWRVGLLAGLGGVMQAARLYAANGLQLGQSYELDAIAAVILGGTSFVGGIGSIWGTLIGALIIAVLTNGLILLGVTDVWQYIAKGAVIIGAVALDRYRLRGSART